MFWVVFLELVFGWNGSYFGIVVVWIGSFFCIVGDFCDFRYRSFWDFWSFVDVKWFGDGELIVCDILYDD